MVSNLIMTPEHPHFDAWYSSFLNHWRRNQDGERQNVSFVMDAQTNNYRPANQQELEDYLEGGEYDQVNQQNDLGITT